MAKGNQGTFAAVLLGTLASSTASWAATATLSAPEDEPVPTITVIGKAEHPDLPLAANADSPTTAYSIDQNSISLFGGLGSVNPYRVIADLPSVSAQSPDSYGFANVPGGTKGLRVRGELSTHGGIGTVDGLPLTEIDPGPGSQWLIDMENVKTVSLVEGPVPPDQASVFTTGGALDSALLWPLAEQHGTIAQSFGSYNLKRSFVRFDTGTLPDGTALFVSGSYTEADKWRGPGGAPDGRKNVEAALSHDFGDRVMAKIFFAWDQMDESNYRPLTYAQAVSLSTFNSFDFLGSPMAGPNYQGYNRQTFQDWTTLAELTYRVTDDLELTFKPFYVSENGYYLDGMPANTMAPNGRVRQWLIDHHTAGVTAAAKGEIWDTAFELGYWWESLNPPGPPTQWKMYGITPTGGLSFMSWAILAEPYQDHELSSPYILLDRHFGPVNVEAGIRYMDETYPGFNEYNTAGIGDVSADQALGRTSVGIANRSATSFSTGEFLPFFAADYKPFPGTTIKLAYGRNYGAPAFDVWPVFQQNSAAFIAKGLTADRLWHTIKPETQDAIDLGVRFEGEWGYVQPTLYYATSQNKGVSYDPFNGTAGSPGAYTQNVGNSHSQGAELAAGFTPIPSLSLFGTASYNENQFDDDLPVFVGAPLRVKGLQLPDVPEWLLSAGATWRYDELAVSPVLHYTGSRFGDTQHTQPIPDYLTVDLALTYEHPLPVGTLKATLEVTNLFDKKYIGFINASYYQLLSGTTAVYYPGAPTTVAGRLAITF